jgi:hypothetical protein
MKRIKEKFALRNRQPKVPQQSSSCSSVAVNPVSTMAGDREALRAAKTILLQVGKQDLLLAGNVGPTGRASSVCAFDAGSINCSSWERREGIEFVLSG